MNIRMIDSTFHVTGQITAAQFADLARQGYRTVICMRPDHEGFSQPVFADMEQAGERAGIQTYYLPVVPGRMTPSQVIELRTVLAGAQGPILAYCASGNRCAAAYDLARCV